MGIDRGSRVDRRKSLVGPTTDAARVDRRHLVYLGGIVAVARTAVMLVLASLAILVLLPAAMAAQAAIAI